MSKPACKLAAELQAGVAARGDDDEIDVMGAHDFDDLAEFANFLAGA